MMQLFQTEWCPSSRRVRQRLTELGVDYVVRQVPVVKSARHVLVDASGSDSIPALVLDDGTAVTGEAAIRAYLDRHFAEPRGAEEQRVKAEFVRRRECREAPPGSSSRTDACPACSASSSTASSTPGGRFSSSR
jgi:glutathione S-transferase